MTTAALELRQVQRVRKAVLAAAVMVLLAMFAFTRATGLGAVSQALVERTGQWLIVICIVGRAWCSLYIGGRKIRDLVQTGPYSLCRNPLYTLSILGAAGAAGQSGSLVMALAGGFVTWLVFRVVVRREEGVLTAIHGQAFIQYRQSTPRFFPDFQGWRGAEILEVRPRLIETTLLDGLLFLLFIPVAHGLAHLAATGLTPVLFNLP